MIDLLMKSQAYRDASHPDHAKTVEQVARLFEAKHPPWADDKYDGLADVLERGKRSQPERIEALPAYTDASHPDHAASVERARRFFEAKYPEPRK